MKDFFSGIEVEKFSVKGWTLEEIKQYITIDCFETYEVVVQQSYEQETKNLSAKKKELYTKEVFRNNMNLKLWFLNTLFNSCIYELEDRKEKDKKALEFYQEVKDHWENEWKKTFTIKFVS